MTDENIITKMRVDGVDYDVRDTSKVSNKYDTSESGKVLGIDDEGDVVPVTGGSAAEWGGITGDISLQGDLQDALATKLGTKITGTGVGNKFLKTDAEGNIITGEGSTSTVEWGNIDGTLSSQSDLSLELAGKVPKVYGTDHKNKVLMTDDEGNVSPVSRPKLPWGQLDGELTDQTDLAEALEELEDNANSRLASNQGTDKKDYYMMVDEDGYVRPRSVTAPGAAWGNIGGQLENQTDLKAALDGKLETNYGSAAEGKILKIDGDGDAIPDDFTPKFSDILGFPDDNTALNTALNGKINNEAIDDEGTVASTKLWSSSKVSALINAMAGVARVEVVAELPAEPVNNTMYYVGTASPYHIYLRANNVTYDMGMTQVDLSGYTKKTDIINNCLSTSTTQPLAANQGKVLNDGKLDKSGGTMTGILNMGSKKITYLATPTDNADASTKAYVDTKAGNYLPLAGGTMSGDITTDKSIIFSGNDATVTKASEDNYMNWYAGGKNVGTGSSLRLCGKGHAYAGNFMLTANNGSGSKSLIGNATGALTWNNNNVITSAGGTISGALNVSGATTHTNNVAVNSDKDVVIGSAWHGMRSSSKSGLVTVYGGSSNGDGACLTVSGADNTHASNGKGKFVLSARDGTNSSFLEGFPDGELIWNHKPVITGATYGVASDIGNYYMEQGAVAFTPKNTTLTFNARRFTHILLMRDGNYVEYIADAWGHLKQLRRTGWSTTELSVTINEDTKVITIKGTYQWQVVGMIERQVSKTE